MPNSVYVVKYNDDDDNDERRKHIYIYNIFKAICPLAKSAKVN